VVSSSPVSNCGKVPKTRQQEFKRSATVLVRR
jgi:hypothetical protein